MDFLVRGREIHQRGRFHQEQEAEIFSAGVKNV